MTYSIFTHRAEIHGLDDARLHAMLCRIPGELINLWAFNWSARSIGVDKAAHCI